MALLMERDYLWVFLAINMVLRWSTLKTFSGYKHRAPLEHSKYYSTTSTG